MKKFLYSQWLFGTAIFLIQVIAFVSIVSFLKDYEAYIMWAISIITFVLLVYEINRSSEPAFKYSWLLLVTVLPIFGSLVYIYIRTNVITKDISRKVNLIIKKTEPYILQNKDVYAKIFDDYQIKGLAEYLYKFGGYSIYDKSSAEYYSIGEEMFEAMKYELRQAKSFIFMEYFIINVKSHMWQEIFEILKEKASKGVEVRVMYDAMGSLTVFPEEYKEELSKNGIKCRTFSKLTALLSSHQNNRDHRKILVIDGKVAFTGGINIADEYINKHIRFGHWKDTAVKITGKAVKSFTVMFLQIWDIYSKNTDNYEKYCFENDGTEEEGYILPYSDSPIDNENVGERVYIDLINSAKRYIYIMTPYLVISYEMGEALKYAAKRGVDVKIMLPHIPDKPYALCLARSYYPDLIKAGVKIYEYEKGFVHAKTTICDDIKAVVGTINYDYRSLYLHYECAALLYNCPAIENIKNDYLNTLLECITITIGYYKKFGFFKNLIGKIMRLFAPLI